MKKYIITRSNGGSVLYPSDSAVFGNSLPVGVVDTLEQAIEYVNKKNNDEKSAKTMQKYIDCCIKCPVLQVTETLLTAEDVEKKLKSLKETCKCIDKNFTSKEIYTRPGAWTAMFGQLPITCEKTHPEAKFSGYVIDCENRLSFEDYMKYEYKFMEIDNLMERENEDTK